MKVTVDGEEKFTAAAKGKDAAIDETLEFILGRKEINAHDDLSVDLEVWDYRLINHFKVNILVHCSCSWLNAAKHINIIGAVSKAHEMREHVLHVRNDSMHVDILYVFGDCLCFATTEDLSAIIIYMQESRGPFAMDTTIPQVQGLNNHWPGTCMEQEH